jgi:hypothetical protein
VVKQFQQSKPVEMIFSMTLQQNLWRITLLCFACLAVAFIVGCGPKTYPVQADLGQTAMKTFLDSWQAGEPFTGLANKSPPITGVDQDWKAGHKLLKYEIVESRSYDRSMQFGVKLTIQRLATIQNTQPVQAQGDEEAGIAPAAVVTGTSTQLVDEQKNANYTVSTKPFITIFRDEAD